MLIKKVLLLMKLYQLGPCKGIILPRLVSCGAPSGDQYLLILLWLNSYFLCCVLSLSTSSTGI